MIPNSELVLNPDGSVYHLNLLPEDIADKIIFVGDPDRVASVSKFFDTVRVRKQKREFVTHTGIYAGKEITVISTGIGTDNIDIVINELDTLANIDLVHRTIRPEKKSLEIIRIGTSGSIQDNIAVDTILASQFGIGMDGMMLFYEFENSELEQALTYSFSEYLHQNSIHVTIPYCFAASSELLMKYKDFERGITLTHNGFYAPQGRELRAKRLIPNYIDIIQQFDSPIGKITNFEMETAGIYGLSSILGHRALSLNLILANRPQGSFSTQYADKMNELIQSVLDKI